MGDLYLVRLKLRLLSPRQLRVASPKVAMFLSFLLSRPSLWENQFSLRCKGSRRIGSMRHPKLCKHCMPCGSHCLAFSLLIFGMKGDGLSQVYRECKNSEATPRLWESKGTSEWLLVFIDSGMIVHVGMAPTVRVIWSPRSWGLCLWSLILVLCSETCSELSWSFWLCSNAFPANDSGPD